jgi:hypothetical protein
VSSGECTTSVDQEFVENFGCPPFEPKLLTSVPISGWSAYATTRTAVVDLVRVWGASSLTGTGSGS